MCFTPCRTSDEALGRLSCFAEAASKNQTLNAAATLSNEKCLENHPETQNVRHQNDFDWSVLGPKILHIVVQTGSPREGDRDASANYCAMCVCVSLALTPKP